MIQVRKCLLVTLQEDDTVEEYCNILYLLLGISHQSIQVELYIELVLGVGIILTLASAIMEINYSIDTVAVVHMLDTTYLQLTT